MMLNRISLVSVLVFNCGQKEEFEGDVSGSGKLYFFYFLTFYSNAKYSADPSLLKITENSCRRTSMHCRKSSGRDYL